MVDNKINTIDKLTELNNTQRLFKRGTVAFENLGFDHQRKHKEKYQELKAKVNAYADLYEQDQVLAQ